MVRVQVNVVCQTEQDPTARSCARAEQNRHSRAVLEGQRDHVDGGAEVSAGERTGEGWSGGSVAHVIADALLSSV